MPKFLEKLLGIEAAKTRLRKYIKNIVEKCIAEDSYKITNTLSSSLEIGKASPNALFASSLCRAEDLLHPTYQAICREDLRCEPLFHRKQWEFVYIIHQLRANGYLKSGLKGLGFGVGTEPLSSLFASYGCEILATDAPEDAISDEGWKQTAQHASSLKHLWHKEIISFEDFSTLCTFQSLDMRAHETIPQGHDFHWSSCVIEHIGGIRAAKEFLLESSKKLNHGGIAIHTTEFNLSSDINTIDKPGTCIFRASDLRQLSAELSRERIYMEPLILDPGIHSYNFHVDTPPYNSKVHLRLELERFAATSIGIVIKKSS
jgi:2-polyprenyl-3-methyl-5-hydroxy-6-metoxy-1,4-benzoquinol methylase